LPTLSQLEIVGDMEVSKVMGVSQIIQTIEAFWIYRDIPGISMGIHSDLMGY